MRPRVPAVAAYDFRKVDGFIANWGDGVRMRGVECAVTFGVGVNEI